jgi:hypothetical protein
MPFSFSRRLWMPWRLWRLWRAAISAAIVLPSLGSASILPPFAVLASLHLTASGLVRVLELPEEVLDAMHLVPDLAHLAP